MDSSSSDAFFKELFEIDENKKCKDCGMMVFVIFD
jgi:hypothetical protein